MSKGFVPGGTILLNIKLLSKICSIYAIERLATLRDQDRQRMFVMIILEILPNQLIDNHVFVR
jgi:hypothetical protein